MGETSVSLLERLRSSTNQEAWQRFVALYTPLLFHWARRVGLSTQDASDLVQDVLLLLVRKLPEFQYQPGKRFRGWLWTVLVNKFRENRRRRDPTAAAAGSAYLSNVDIAAPDELAEISEEEYRHHLVRQALCLMKAEFQPSTWKACWDSVVEGKSAEVLGAELGLSPGAIRAARFRVLSRLRNELGGLLD
jgi:RNA polymerase sigma-70 factor (ECF subfamily)